MKFPEDAPPPRAAAEAARQVTVLYQVHGLNLVRLAVVMLGDQPTAEEVVQDAFLGLYRRWRALDDQDRALAYVRASVVNGCRMAYRQRMRRERVAVGAAGGFWQQERDIAESAEAIALIGEEHREVMVALLRLPARQREALVLRYYMDLPEAQIAAVMQVSPGTVKSATSRGLAALGRLLMEES